MNEFGHYSLFMSWCLALFCTVGGIYAGILTNKAHKRSRAWTGSIAAATISGLCFCTLSVLALGYLFHYDEYTNQYVWQFSNRDMSPIYKVSAIWGGMDGSMLLWCFFLSICGALVAWWSNSYPRKLVPWALAAINSSSLFFLSVTFLVTNPFRNLQSQFIPPDGNGLNPLLQNPFMAIHPPTLYVGFTAHAVPFAFCIAALCSGNLSSDWIRATRRWLLVAWAFLTCGIVLGGYWAYIELGWGGFWAWDPVENSSFFPWLTSTAVLHSVMVQERKNMLKVWNVALMILSYALTVFGTFLTRSGIVQSVHSFASTDIGWVFLAYLGGLALVSVLLVRWRWEELKPERRIESFLSREAFFLLNNLVLLSIAFATLWGVLFPVLSEALTGKKQAVGIPYFNAVNVPLFLMLIFLMGIGPLIAWRKATISSLRRIFLAPFIASLVVGVVLVWAGVTGFYPVLSYCLCFFVLMTILAEVHRGMKSQRAALPESSSSAAAHLDGLQRLLRRNHVRYGGYLVHTGVLVATVAITASMAHKIEQEIVLGTGESYEIGRFRLTMEGFDERRTANYAALHTIVRVDSRKDSNKLALLEPELRNYFRNDERTSEVSIYKSIREDLYIVVAGLDETGKKAALKIYINPLQLWLWVGVFVMMIGTIIVLIPQRQPMALRLPEGARQKAA